MRCKMQILSVQVSQAKGYSTVMGVMSAVLLDPTEQANMENMLSEGDLGLQLRRQMYENARFKKHAETALTWLNQRGILDIEDSESETWNAPTFEIPDWIDESYFNDVLTAQLQADFSKILSLHTEIATKSGDNYASIVLKVDITAELKDGTTKIFNYILKVPPGGEQTKFLTEMWHSFEKEIMAYKVFIPAYEAMYKEAGLELKFAPAYYQLKKDPGCDTVLLENLQSCGFKNADRLEGLDAKHTENVLRKMAQYHAASVKYIENGGSYPAYFNNGIYNEKSREMFEQIMEGTNHMILESSSLYNGNEDFYGKLKPIIDTFLEKAIALNDIDPNEFNVLNHNDCWVNNIMFQYDDNGNLKETYLIDFQDCKYGPPAHDLYYFLISSTQLDIKVQKFDYFIKYYHDSLTEHLNLLNYKGKIPTLRELHESLLKYGFIGLSTLWGVTTLCLLEPTENASIDTLMNDTEMGNEFRVNLYSNPRYKAHAELVLSWLNQRGTFDC